MQLALLDLTSLTSAAGFASLALADIPPVRVFGLFVAFGIMAAWLFSMTMVPAVISLMSEARLRKGLWPHEGGEHSSFLEVIQSEGNRFAILHRNHRAKGMTINRADKRTKFDKA